LFILPAVLRDVLRQRQLWEDVQQEIALAVIIASQQGLGLKETSRFVQREVYRALREMGLRKARGGRWEWWEWGEEEIDEEVDMNEEGGDEDE
jgi:cytochrome P450